MPDERLAHYREKRDFVGTPEPAGEEPLPAGEYPRFVVQLHDASHLHYDFRLEVDGVLKSWAVPKGPSTDPKVKRLAIPTEDHPLSYLTFEGTIPAGHYGAGTVMVWDLGIYQHVTHLHGQPISMAQALAKGHVQVLLAGQKLRGGYALIHTRGLRGGGEGWLLVKSADPEANADEEITRTQTRSVLSGRTLEEIAAGE